MNCSPDDKALGQGVYHLEDRVITADEMIAVVAVAGGVHCCLAATAADPLTTFVVAEDLVIV